MRTYGRVKNEDGSKTWVVVETSPEGYNDFVYLTTLIQCMKLNLGESPFYAQYGIPAKPSVVQQVFPDFYVVRMQKQFAPFFASLIISKEPSSTPTYLVNVTTQQGVRVPTQSIQVPT